MRVDHENERRRRAAFLADVRAQRAARRNARLNRELAERAALIVRRRRLPLAVPQFDVYTTPAGGRVHMVHGIVTGRGGIADDLVLLEQVIELMKRALEQQIMQETGWTLQATRARLTGYFNAVSIENPLNHAGEAIPRWDQFNHGDALALIERIHTSNDLITILDIRWQFTIDPNVFLAAGAGGLRAPKGMKIPDLTWQDNGVNCAAFALNYRMHFGQTEYLRTRNVVTQIRDARAMATRLGWNDDLRPDELGRFVEEYPEWRIVVLDLSGKSLTFRFVGELFVLPPHGPRHDWKDGGKTAYLVVDYSVVTGDGIIAHYALVKTPTTLKKNRKGQTGDWAFCHRKCLINFSGSHDCGAMERTLAKSLVPCKACGLMNGPDHVKKCPKYKCKTCKSFPNKGFDHRCIVVEDMPSEKNNTWMTGEPDGKFPALISLDFECALIPTKTNRLLISKFRTDAQGQFLKENVCVYSYDYESHIPNFVSLEVCWTRQKVFFEGEGCLDKMMLWLGAFNDGNCICYAHNGKGYDIPLLFKGICDNLASNPGDISLITTGGKIMQMKFQNLIFRDTLCHLPGSLKSLIKDFGGDEDEKGFYPYYFNNNSEAHENYIGELPDDKWWDIRTLNDPDWPEFKESWRGRTDWNHREQRRTYGCNDTSQLANIMENYSTIFFDITSSPGRPGLQPLMKMTAPSFIHQAYLTSLTFDLELDEKEGQDRLDYVQKLAREEHWAVSKPQEYWFDRLAFRGGRTDMCKLFDEISDEDWASGDRHDYIDVKSLYPSIQLDPNLPFPVGIPKIFVWNMAYFPCLFHSNSRSAKCSCYLNPNWPKKKSDFLDIADDCPEVSAGDLIRDHQNGCWGTLVVDVVPPKNLTHAILVRIDVELEKSVASLEEQTELPVVLNMLVLALEYGYVLKRVHRYQRYKTAPPKWDLLKKLIVLKEANSGPAPEGEAREEYLRIWEEKYGMGDMLRESMESEVWALNKAKRQCAKIGANCGWGKHCQRPIMDERLILDHSDEPQKVYNFFKELSLKRHIFKGALCLDANRVMYTYEQNSNTSEVNMHNGSLVAGMAVPAYGQELLMRTILKIDPPGEKPRVAFNDTDSIHFRRQEGRYNAEDVSGDCLGLFGKEKIQTQNGGIVAVYGLAPKTYAILCKNGKIDIKAKGLTLGYETGKQVNLETFKRLAYKAARGEKEVVKVSQRNFVRNAYGEIQTHYSMKQLKVNMDKGVLKDGFLYPFGFEFQAI